METDKLSDLKLDKIVDLQIFGLMMLFVLEMNPDYLIALILL
jgi:hypothetical protein